MKTLLMAFMALAFACEEAQLFGWHLMPQSPQEVMCDGIGIVILGMTLILFHIEHSK